MSKKSIDLLVATHPDWVRVILDNFDEFLQDHANCERKASALAMSLVVKYADRRKIVPGLISLAMEELEHFAQVYALLEARDLPLVKDTQDPYVNQLLALMRHGRDERLIDQLLIASLIECRGAERFKIIAEALDDPELSDFYTSLWKAETKHGHQFVQLLSQEFDEPSIYPRLQALAAEESRILQELEWRPALH